MKKSKGANQKLGRQGERAAARFLRRNGYRIIGRNVQMTSGELDIIAQNKQYIVFVEVKTRTESPYLEKYPPYQAVNLEKRKHLVYAAKEYLRKNPMDKKPRGDIIQVFVTKGGIVNRNKYRIEHLENMFSIYDYRKKFTPKGISK